MVNFELGKEIEKDVFHLVVSRAWDKENNLTETAYICENKKGSRS